MSRPEWQRAPRRVARSDAPCIVLVTGATGFIGRSLCRRLLADGHSVIALTRNGPRARAVFGSMVRVIVSLDEIISSERIDWIVNLAGAPIFAGLWTPARRTELLDSRLNVTNKITELIARLTHKPDVLINASAIGYYGVRGEEEITEAARGQPIFQSHLCQAWELAAQAAEQYDVRVCRLRFGIVLGMSGGALPGLLRPARMRLRVLLGSGQQWQSWVHIDDLLDLLWFCIRQEDMSGGINVTSPRPVRQQEFAATLAAQFGRSIPVRVPARILRASLGELSQLLLEGQRVLPTKALNAGFAFRYPELNAALADLLRTKDPAAG
ncbi:TIGR01777 family oxidoreductase [Peristeroidobacter soli]|uniref:TIGR01777 family oxidoreductase n=1 Tax=Peristeroidobacter soli TaxID=2497877 RepID=UPI00101BAEE8|nr:TIGR01777 family oxidoreductase [Peristeroidobacter soli]